MDGREMADGDVDRAAERLRLACRALSAAARDLRVAKDRDAADVTVSTPEIEGEIERVHEMAEQLSEFSRRRNQLAAA